MRKRPFCTLFSGTHGARAWSGSTAAASVTSLARSLGSSTSPVLAGLLLQGPWLVLGIPFFLAGGLKAAYDLTLWTLFRQVHLKEEPELSSLPAA